MKALYFENKIIKVAVLNVTSKFNKYAALGRFSPTRYSEIPEPQIPNQRWLKVKNKSCGLCGTDIHFIFMQMDPKCSPAAAPGISRKYLGHELVAEVTEAGSEAGDIKVGDRVSLRIDWPSCFQMEIDPPCRQCRLGNYMLCENLGKKTMPIVDTGGGFSPYMVMHRTQPYKIPDTLSDAEAILLEPTACAVHGVFKQKPSPGDKVLVIGCGTIGLLTVAVARAIQQDAKIYALARYPFQAEMAMKLGADGVLVEDKDIYRHLAKLTGANYWQGYFGNKILLGGFDVVYDSIGNDKTINDALRWTRAGGNIVILGINFKPGKIDYTPIWYQEVNIIGMNCHANESEKDTSFDVAARLISEKKIKLEGIITHRFPMDRYKDAIKTFFSKRESKAIKVVLDHEVD
ncbi:MAG: zinc-binding dehydrogenase [Deltaproteobacteria bacterium]|nr:zinc-binding dehydrogenase [Deltaproteobacteria bacterium]